MKSRLPVVHPLGAAPEPNPVSIGVSNDPVLGALILGRDYYDAPVCHFPAALRRALAASWSMNRPDVAFLVAMVGGQYAGFVLAQTLGRAFWRTMALEHPRHAVAFGRAWLKTRRRPGSGRSTRAETSRPKPDVPHLGRPFAWSPVSARAGALEMVFVASGFRKMGVGRQLIDAAAAAVSRGGARSIEAHIDGDNTASVLSFLAAGWQVYLTASNDYLATRQLGDGV